MMLLGGLLTATAGAAVGSYVGTAALRATLGEDSVFGRSRCDGCRRSLAAWETIPLVSYAAARGACRACGERIAMLHPAAEAMGGGVALAIWAFARSPQTGALMAVIAAALLAASVIDIRRLRLPDALTLVVALAGAALAWLRSPLALVEGAVAAAIAFGLLAALRWLSSRRGRDPGLGLGDVKLVAAFALWLGALTPWMVAVAAGIGLAVAAAGGLRQGRIPFGPMLALAGFGCGFGLEAGWWPG